MTHDVRTIVTSCFPDKAQGAAAAVHSLGVGEEQIRIGIQHPATAIAVSWSSAQCQPAGLGRAPAPELSVRILLSCGVEESHWKHPGLIDQEEAARAGAENELRKGLPRLEAATSGEPPQAGPG